jgi:hypothetical protein
LTIPSSPFREGRRRKEMGKLVLLYMIAISHLSNIVPLAAPVGEVKGGEEIEAVYVPAGYEGPIVAAPFSVEVF